MINLNFSGLLKTKCMYRDMSPVMLFQAVAWQLRKKSVTKHE